MRIHDDLTIPTFVQGSALDWIPSPAPGVERRMLYRVGEEVARATSIVRYAPGCAFPSHNHDGGEEILVLEGTFQDEHGDYPAGSYFRNPPGTHHAPASATGCIIFVRLWQHRRGDRQQILRQPGEGDPLPPRPNASAARRLFQDEAETVTIETWPPAVDLLIENPQGLECLVVSGEVILANTRFLPQAWLRLPAGTDLEAKTGSTGATLWIKSAPLQHDIGGQASG